MKARIIVMALACCFAGAVLALAADSNPNVGTWKLNEAKSKIPAGSPKNLNVVYSVAGDQFKCVVDGVDGAGKPTHNEWTGKFDGKDYALKGDPTADTRAIKQVDAHHYEITNKKGGKATTTGKIAFSPDGKTRTLTTEWTDASGKKMSATTVFDKQ